VIERTDQSSDQARRDPGINQPAMSNAVEFSLMLGGPLYQLWRRTRLSGDVLQLLRRRVVASILISWVPLLLLSIIAGNAWGGRPSLPFLEDLESHARLLLAIPLLLVAEVIVHRRLRNIAAQFLDRDLIPQTGRGAFDAAIASAMRLRNSKFAELLLLAVVYVVGVGLIWRTRMAFDVNGYYGFMVNQTWHLSLAGWWLVCVSLPLFQFLLLRWYYRLSIWAWFLWKVSRIDLNITAAHPDRCGGLSFLGATGYAFSLLLLAQGVVLAGMMANRIFFAGAKLPDFKPELIGLVAVLVCAVLGPLLVFTLQLAAAKRAGLREYGTLAQQYVREYEYKWLRGGAAPGEQLVGSNDIQSLADMGNSFEVVKEMRLVPFTLRTVLRLAVTTLLPALPLTLTMMPTAELLDRLLKIIF
jgi:hypothetical protein